MKPAWRLALLGAGFAALWVLLSDAAAGSWLIGVPAVAAAVWVATRLAPRDDIAVSPIGVLRFLPYFARESVRGGWDMARRIATPRMPIAPGFVMYQTRLRGEHARVYFANCVCLLPGTLAATLDGDRIELHLIDTGIDPYEELRRLECAVQRIYPPRETAAPELSQ